MRILWITSRLLPDACRAMGWGEDVVGGWMQSQLNALLRTYGNAHEYLILSSDRRRCDITIGSVRHRSFGEGNRTYDRRVPAKVEAEARSVISSFDPDVIHIHGTEFFYGRMTSDVYCGKPVVVSLQGILQGYLPYVCGALSRGEVFWQQFNIRRFLFGSTMFSEQSFWRDNRVPQEELVFKTHRCFMGRTAWDRAWTKVLNPVARYFHVNETLRDFFYSGDCHSRADIRPHSIYCSAAAGYPLKGAHILLRAVAYLKEKYPDISLRVCAAERVTRPGSLMSLLNADQYTSYLRCLVRDLGIRPNIVGLPRLTADMVAEELSRAEIFVLPSFCENSPNSLGEAQLVETPAIATFVGGTSSLLRDGVDGRLVPPGDPATLADMIDWYFAHPEDARKYAIAAREQALVRHDPRLNAEATMKTYEELVKS